MVRWPHDEQRRRELAARRVPRLLVVEDDVPAPEGDDCLEDWVRMPVGDADIGARARTLARRRDHHRAAHQAGAGLPSLDGDGVLRAGDHWAPLPPVEARLMREFIRRFGAVVSRSQLAAAGWPAQAPGRNVLDVHVLRLRRRIDPLGLAIRTVRARGYLMETRAGGAATA